MGKTTLALQLAATSDRDSSEWRRQFIRTVLEHDIPQLGPRVPAETLRRFWTTLAHGQGSLLNAAELGRSLDLRVDLLLVRRLPPLLANVGKRLVFALLSQPALITGTSKTLQDASGVALGSVPGVLGDLEQQGLLRRLGWGKGCAVPSWARCWCRSGACSICSRRRCGLGWPSW